MLRNISVTKNCVKDVIGVAPAYTPTPYKIQSWLTEQSG